MEELTAEQQVLADKIQDILTKKRADGEWYYTQDEVRDFIAAAVFEWKLPTPPDVQRVVLSFLEQFKLPEDTTDDELLAAVTGYFDEHPLNPELMKEFQALGRGELMKKGEGYKETAGELREAMQAVGKDADLAAPEDKPKKKKPKLKKGLS